MKSRILLFLLVFVVLVFNTTLACYNIYNITLEGEVEGTLKIRKIQSMGEFQTNCSVDKDYIECTDEFYFYGKSTPYSSPFVFEKYSFPYPHIDAEYLEKHEGSYSQKARNLTEGIDSYMEAVLAISSWIYSNITYTSELNSLERTFNQGKGNCESVSLLGVEMLRAVGIPSRVAYGWKGREQHAWIEVYYPSNEWFQIDLSYGRYGYLGKDYLLLGYEKENYLISPKDYDYKFEMLGEEECGVTLNKRGKYVYNKKGDILTYKENDYGSWPLVIQKGYTEYEELNGFVTSESLTDKVWGLILELKSFLNKE